MTTNFLQLRPRFLAAVRDAAAANPMQFADEADVAKRLGVSKQEFADVVIYCLQHGDLDQNCPIGSIKLSLIGRGAASRM